MGHSLPVEPSPSYTGNAVTKIYQQLERLDGLPYRADWIYERPAASAQYNGKWDWLPTDFESANGKFTATYANNALALDFIDVGDDVMNVDPVRVSVRENGFFGYEIDEIGNCRGGRNFCFLGGFTEQGLEGNGYRYLKQEYHPFGFYGYEQ